MASIDVPETDVRICPGCGGRHAPGAEVCDWCGRSFSGREPASRLRLWLVAGGTLLALTLAAVTGLGVLLASRPSLPTIFVSGPARGTPTVDVAAATAPNSPDRPPGSPSPRALADAASKPSASPTPAPPPAPPPAPTTPPARYARVFNTGGLGVNLRREPGPQGQPVTAAAENTLLRLVGPEETVQARLWRLCELESRGVQGWVPADFLQSTDATPGPGG